MHKARKVELCQTHHKNGRSIPIVSYLQCCQAQKAFIRLKLCTKNCPCSISFTYWCTTGKWLPWPWNLIYRFSKKCFLCNHLLPDGMKTLKKMHFSDHIGRLKRHCPHKQCYPWSKLPTLWFFEENSSPLWKAVAVSESLQELSTVSSPAVVPQSPWGCLLRGETLLIICVILSILILFYSQIICYVLQHRSRCFASVYLSFICFCLYSWQCLYCLPYDELAL